MTSRRPFLRPCLCRGLLLAAAFLAIAAPLPADAAELICKPLYSIEDHRSIRPADATRSPHVTHYLFRNAELLHYSIAYRHRKHLADDVPLNWPEDLEATVRPTDGSGGPTRLSFEVLRRQVSERRFTLDGEPVTGSFLERARGWDPQPAFEHNSSEVVSREVEAFPQQLRPLDRAILEARLLDRDGQPIEPGVYELKLRDARTGLACEPHLLVMREPRSELDHTDEWIVRFLFHEARGDAEAATDALRRATEVSPNCLKAWYYRAADGWSRADLEAWEAAADQMERILVERGGHVMPVRTSIQRFAHSTLKHRDESRARILERVAERAEGGAS